MGSVRVKKFVSLPRKQATIQTNQQRLQREPVIWCAIPDPKKKGEKGSTASPSPTLPPSDTSFNTSSSPPPLWSLWFPKLLSSPPACRISSTWYNHKRHNLPYWLPLRIYPSNCKPRLSRRTYLYPKVRGERELWPECPDRRQVSYIWRGLQQGSLKPPYLWWFRIVVEKSLMKRTFRQTSFYQSRRIEHNGRCLLKRREKGNRDKSGRERERVRVLVAKGWDEGSRERLEDAKQPTMLKSTQG